MKATLATRAAPFVMTTFLIAPPAWAQQAGQTGTTPTPPPATSQQAPAEQMGSTAPSGAKQKGVHGTRHPGETTQSMVERRIADLRAKLHITSQQSQQWDQFAQVMRDNAQEMDQTYRQRFEKLGQMSAVDNIESYAQVEEQRAREVQKMIQPFQALYAALSDAQKKTADDLFRTYGERQARRQAAAK